MNKIVMFDVCGTLFYSNTTFDFIKYYHKKQSNFFRFIYVSLLTGLLGKILHRYFKVSIRQLIISTLNKEIVANVEAVAESFVASYLKYKVIPSVFNKFVSLKENSDVYLISASIDPVVKKIADFYNVKYICSTLARNGDNYIGKIEKDLKGNKCGYMSKEVIFYSDNLDDLSCSFLVDKYYFIRHKMSDRYKKMKFCKNIEVLNV